MSNWTTELGDGWNHLSDAQREVLERDIASMLDECLTMSHAARELLRRVGGTDNLDSYCTCLLAGEARRARLAR